MSGWFSKNLGDGILASEPLARIEEVFREKSAGSGMSEAMAVFVRYTTEGRLHCEVDVYFSPGAAAVARTVDAEPCGKPAPEGLSLLAGTDACWRALFPEANKP